MNEKVRPGFHPFARTEVNRLFSSAEVKIAEKWSHEWYVTHAGAVNMGAKCDYKYILVKATRTYEEILGISREIVVVISSYSEFEPRTLDAFEGICKLFQSNRIERICYVMISADGSLEKHLSDCLSNQGSQVIVPFSFSEFNGGEDGLIKNKFRNSFYARDLFDISTPLKNDYYFFGRSNASIEVIQKHRQGQNYGLFGLRKTGKTSICNAKNRY